MQICRIWIIYYICHSISTFHYSTTNNTWNILGTNLMIKQIFLRRMVIVERMMTLVTMCRMVAWKWQDWGWILTWEGKVLQPNLWRNLKRYFRCIHLFHITHITHCWVLLFNNIKEHHTWCCLFILAVKFVEVYCIWALGSPIRLLCMWTLICEHFLLKWKAPFVVHNTLQI